MPTALQRIPGPKLRLKFFGSAVFTPWVNFDVSETAKDDDVSAGGSRVMQRITDILDAAFNLTFYNSADFNMAGILIDTPIVEMEIVTTETGNPELLAPDFFTNFPLDTWKINEKSLKQDRKSGQVSIKALPNYLDIPAVA